MSSVAADPLSCPKLQDLEPRYLCQPASSALIAALQADRDPAHWHEIYRRFDSELLE